MQLWATLCFSSLGRGGPGLTLLQGSEACLCRRYLKLMAAVIQCHYCASLTTINLLCELPRP